MGWTEPYDFSDVDKAFPVNVVEHMPPWDEIPDEFKRWSHPAHKVADRWFFNELVHNDPKPDFHPKPGMSAELAFFHIHTVLSSFQPKHEHKIAGAAVLIDRFFAKIVKGDEIVYEAPSGRVDKKD